MDKKFIGGLTTALAGLGWLYMWGVTQSLGYALASSLCSIAAIVMLGSLLRRLLH